ncbi:reactive intermediate/imine deaminase [Psychrobacter sp. TAE2020]|uniref:RidA family protein n=1 Tax=Psychrobacter sp. TAE2020 TaxID=2846762 RepID=UPI001C0FA94C|nr:RidA family protein [Psychrobacter sp. TAE2020]MBU5616351.1 reactive intermediate/imine deaminase [Psychrobacter sp. TAE2020]
MNNIIIKASRNTDSVAKCSLSTQTVAFSHYNHLSGQLPVDPQTKAVVAGDISAQTTQCLDNIKAIVESIGHVMDDVVKITIFLKDITDIAAVDAVYATFFQSYLPTRTVLAVAALPMDKALILIDAVISNGEGTQPQAPCDLVKVTNNTDNAPKTNVSTQTVAFSHYNNISAQLPIDPKTGSLVSGDVKQQTAQCLRNIKAILQSIDVPIDDIVKVNIFLTDLTNTDAVNEVYSTFFPDSAIARTVGYLPARTVSAATALPMQALVQIDAVVSHGDGTPPQEVEDRHGIVIKANNTTNAPKSSVATQTVAFSHYNNISAQLPISVESGKMITGDVTAQATQCLENIKAILQSIDHVMDDVVKVNIQLKNIADIDAVNDIYTPFFNSDLPARTVIGVSAIPMDALIQIDAVVSNAEGTPPAL